MKDLAYRERISEIGQFKANISVGKTWAASTDLALNDVNLAIRDAYSAIGRSDLMALTEEAAAISGIPYVMDAYREEAMRILEG